MKTGFELLNDPFLNKGTAFTQEDKRISERQEGISIWAINLDFVVSHDGQ